MNHKFNKIEEAAKRYIWHPFTQMKEWEESAPLIIERGESIYLYDIQGNRYIDGVSSLWVNLHGHRKKEIDRAIISQIKKISHSTLLGLTNIPAVRLAEELIKIAPKGLAKVFYSDDGSTAMEVALKMAFQYWQHRGFKNKKRFITFANAYHGDTVGAVSLGGISLFHGTYKPLLFSTIKADYPYCYRCRLGKSYPSCSLKCIDRIESTAKKHSRSTAGLVIEPLVQAAAGMFVSPPGYLARIREICTKYKILMIADEVATGFGRTGRMFACEHEGVTPDIMAIAKGITGGYLPLAATLTTQEIYDAFLGEYAEFKTFFHGHSYTGNQLGCAAALANLKIFKKEKIIEELGKKIKYFSKILEPLNYLPHVGDIRQKGMISAIELVKEKKGKTAYPIEDRIGTRVAAEALRRGMIIRPLVNIIVLMPPFAAGLKDIKKMVEIIRESIESVTG